MVSLRRCTKITNAGIAALTLSGSLRSLNISGVINTGPAALKALATSCTCAVLSVMASAVLFSASGTVHS